MGPITGEINIAPIITGMEFRFRPTLAIIIAQARMKTVIPRKWMFLRRFMFAAWMSVSFLTLMKVAILPQIFVSIALFV